MLSTRPRSTAAVSLFLSYQLIVLLCAPFAISGGSSSGKGVTPQENAPVRYREGEVLVRFREGVSEKEKETIVAAHGGRKKKQLKGDSDFEKLELAAGRDAKTAVLQLLLNPHVQFAEPNFLIAKEDVNANDPQFSEQWALQNSGQDGGQIGSDIGARSAWDKTKGATSTVIAVIDSGIDFTHPDLVSNQWTNPLPGAAGDLHGWDFVDDNGEIKDEQGHGTAVAGIIAAEGNNAIGTTGVMWRAGLMSLRVLDNTGTGDVGNAVEAIDYAVAHGAHVINLSWGTIGESIALREAIERAIRRNVIVVCSAGNNGQDLDATPYYPASYGLKDLIVVSATDNRDQLASWSNWGTRTVTVGAPGTNILTTQRGGGYWSVTGTSAAAPIVSGIAGLLKTVSPGANTTIVAGAISRSVRQNISLSGKVSSGGVVDAAAALEKVHGSGNQPPPFLPPGIGSGGNGPRGSFSTTPPPLLRDPPANLPNLDQTRKATYAQPKASAPIQANLPCADCDPYGGGGGGGNYPSGDPNFSGPRGRPTNETGQPGVDLGSQNVNWSVPMVSLPGRAGLDLNLTLTYNSLVWTKDGSFIKFNADMGNPAPGFRLGLPILQQRFFNAATGIYAYMMVTSSGSRVELRQVGSSNIYESQDSTYVQLDVSDPNALLLRTKDGTRYTFVPVTINSEYRCTEIKDRNGNYISASYNTTSGHVDWIKDTLNRTLNFIYDGNGNLQAIRQTWAGNVSHDWATFSYGQVWVAPGFGGNLQINGPNNNSVTVLTRVDLHDGSFVTFNYNDAFAQVKRINNYAADGHLLNYTSYNMNSSAGQTDCPKFSEQRDWAEYWNGGNEAVTSYSTSGDGSWTQVTTPDGTTYKEFFHTSGWQSGLTHTTEVWVGGVKKKWTTTSYTQDDESLTYQKNPRVTETNVYDEAGNRRRVTISYYSSTSFNLPSDVYEYAADGSTLLRRTHTDYTLDSVYTDRRIIGLIFGQYVYDGAGTLKTKETFRYDWTDPWIVSQTGAVQHDDVNYGIGFVVGRGNLVLAERWDVNYPEDTSRVLSTKYGYNTTGSLIFTGDGLWHRTDFSYADAFSDGVNHTTYAYATTITNPDSFSATLQYNYDFGSVTREQDPKGTVRTITYDGAARLDRVTNQTNGAYTRYAYAPDGSVATYTTIENGAGEAFQIRHLDGAGQVRAVAADHPGSSGLYAGVFTNYDVMGRVSQQSNPTEISAMWVPSGDDVGGWSSTLQTYDWKGRPLLTTNPDGSTRESSYGGCGCAGGEQTTTRDERGRRRRFTKDVFGRLSKVEELNWDQSVYATTNYTYNVRDQITEINHAGQLRTSVFDGYGRLQRRTTPEQGATEYTYFANGMTQIVTDARGATTTFAYNNRDLVTSITYGVPSGVAATPNVTFEYDSAGNRTSMNDGLGSVSYVYNTLSQLTSETRTFTGVTGSFALSYDYNLGGELKSITNPWGAQVGYGYDKTGRPANVSGSGYAGLSSYVNSFSYRAFGLKQMAYNNTRTLSMQYDNRMRPSQWNIPGVMGWNYFYQYFNENSGRLTYAQNINDGTLDRSYHYDHVGRLQSSFTGTSARAQVGISSTWFGDGPYAAHDYVYDVWGNNTARSGWGGSNPQYSTSFTNNKMNSMVYDASGNLADAGGGWTFTYDATSRQTYSAVGNLQNWYDGDRLRSKKSENGAITYYIRSSVLGGQVVAEITNGVWVRGYVYLGGQLLAVQCGGVYWVHQDPLVKSKRVTDGSGTVVSTVELDAWGGETNRSSNEAFQPRKFTSYERDSIASDDAMNRRYNRWWGRFEQPDPYDGSYDITNPQTFNRYSYVNNDPVNFVDPLGLDPDAEGGLGSMAALGIGPYGTVTERADGFNGVGGGGEVTMALAPLGRSALQNPARPPIPAENLAANVTDLLNSDCGKFVTSLIDAVAAATKNPAHSNNALNLFNTINGRQGGVVFEDNLRVGGRSAAGTVSGAIGNSASPPVVHIQTSVLIAGPLTPAIISATQHSYAMTAIHETIHHAGMNGYYSDEQLARAAYRLTGAPGLPEDGADVFEWSGYWDSVLQSKCPPVRK
jgi:RHS repeat-associated protein